MRSPGCVVSLPVTIRSLLRCSPSMIRRASPSRIGKAADSRFGELRTPIGREASAVSPPYERLREFRKSRRYEREGEHDPELGRPKRGGSERLVQDRQGPEQPQEKRRGPPRSRGEWERGG